MISQKVFLFQDPYPESSVSITVFSIRVNDRTFFIFKLRNKIKLVCSPSELTVMRQFIAKIN